MHRTVAASGAAASCPASRERPAEIVMDESYRTTLARLHGVHKHYGAVHALRGVDLSLHGGELLALLGPNGAGKTTAIALLLGLLRADRGEVDLFGRDPQDIAARRH